MRWALPVFTRGRPFLRRHDHTALGQALGFVYQFDRAAFRLLQADALVVSVGVENVDDVTEVRADGTSVREQDKATIRSRDPLTDRSVALWKTLSIWATDVAANPAVLQTCEFHLVTNGTITQGSLASRLHAAKTPAAIEEATRALLAQAIELRDELKEFGQAVVGLGRELLPRLIGRVYVFDATCEGFAGSLETVPCLRLLAPLQRVTVFDGAVGFVKRTIAARARANEPSLVDRVAFDTELRALFRRAAVAPLAIVLDPGASAGGFDEATAESLGYIRQLDWIDSDPEFVRECYIHHEQARATRLLWAETGEVSEATLRAYQEDLKIRWRLVVRREARKRFASPIEQGQNRLDESLSEDTTLDGQLLPKAITCGNFHALADYSEARAPEIGWHPDFEAFAKKAKL